MVKKVIIEEWQTSDGRSFASEADAMRHEDKLTAPQRYSKAYGTWEVTTEGDVEGRTTKHLGTYTGYLDEIAFSLADLCYYSLTFKSVKPLELRKDKTNQKSVCVRLDSESNTWDMDSNARVNHFRNMLDGRGIMVKSGGSFAAVTLGRD